MQYLPKTMAESSQLIIFYITLIQGQCIGGGNETSTAHKSGQLEQKLRAAGAIV